MGIKQLGKFLKTNCSSAMNCHTYAGDYKAGAGSQIVCMIKLAACLTG